MRGSGLWLSGLCHVDRERISVCFGDRGVVAVPWDRIARILLLPHQHFHVPAYYDSTTGTVILREDIVVDRAAFSRYIRRCARADQAPHGMHPPEGRQPTSGVRVFPKQPRLAQMRGFALILCALSWAVDVGAVTVARLGPEGLDALRVGVWAAAASAMLLLLAAMVLSVSCLMDCVLSPDGTDGVTWSAMVGIVVAPCSLSMQLTQCHWPEGGTVLVVRPDAKLRAPVLSYWHARRHEMTGQVMRPRWQDVRMMGTGLLLALSAGLMAVMGCVFLVQRTQPPWAGPEGAAADYYIAATSIMLTVAAIMWRSARRGNRALYGRPGHAEPAGLPRTEDWDKAPESFPDAARPPKPECDGPRIGVWAALRLGAAMRDGRQAWSTYWLGSVMLATLALFAGVERLLHGLAPAGTWPASMDAWFSVADHAFAPLALFSVVLWAINGALCLKSALSIRPGLRGGQEESTCGVR